ncbi:MAG: hypothetical protein Kow00124_30980 [Anaerolineae bacterium]
MKVYRRPVVGLALSGGGARGLAHIGVLKVLEREGIPVDCLAGASMGGAIAAGYAAGMPPAELEKQARWLARPRNLLSLIDLRAPYGGLIRGEKVREHLVEMLGGDLDFNQLRMPLAVTAVDLVTGKEHWLRDGSVVDAVRATGAFPGVFEPVVMGQRHLTDGGVLNNLPVDVARALGAEVVIGVSVGLDFYDPALGQNPGAPLLMRLSHNVWRAQAIATEALVDFRLKEARPELVIRPAIPAEITALQGYSRAEEVIAAGERAAEAALDRIRKLTRPALRFRQPQAAYRDRLG